LEGVGCGEKRRGRWDVERRETYLGEAIFEESAGGGSISALDERVDEFADVADYVGGVSESVIMDRCKKGSG
jgi:hypothetical protein